MRKNRISEFLESIDSTKWNCVYQANGMTLLTAKEYNYRYEEIDNLRKQCKKQKEAINKVIEIIKEYKECNWSKYDENEIEIELIDKILEILKGSDSNE